MKVKDHIIATVIISSFVYYVFNSLPAFISSLVGGLLIDIDHLIDYYLDQGINFKVRNFFIWCHSDHWTRLTLFLHSFELVFILWGSIIVFNLGVVWVGFAIGFSQHLVFDMIFNGKKIKVYSYFFLYRFANGFKKEYILRRR